MGASICPQASRSPESLGPSQPVGSVCCFFLIDFLYILSGMSQKWCSSLLRAPPWVAPDISLLCDGACWLWSIGSILPPLSITGLLRTALCGEAYLSGKPGWFSGVLHSPPPLRTVVSVEQGEVCAEFGVQDKLRNLLAQPVPPKSPEHDSCKFFLLTRAHEAYRCQRCRKRGRCGTGTQSVVSATTLDNEVGNSTLREKTSPWKCQAAYLTQEWRDVVKAIGLPWAEEHPGKGQLPWWRLDRSYISRQI